MIYWELAACQRERHARLQNDVSHGGWNNCNCSAVPAFCCSEGFTAAPRTGLDPLTGMGSVSILRMLQVIP
jgi:hypothetical protein